MAKRESNPPFAGLHHSKSHYYRETILIPKEEREKEGCERRGWMHGCMDAWLRTSGLESLGHGWWVLAKNVI